MHDCAFCKNPLGPFNEWKGKDGRFYCNEFCADAEGTDIPTQHRARGPQPQMSTVQAAVGTRAMGLANGLEKHGRAHVQSAPGATA